MSKARGRIRVVFLVFYFEAWDSLADVHRLMLESDDFEPIVVTIPRKLTGDADFGNEQAVSDFFTNLDIEHVRLDFEDSYRGLSELKKLAPDYLFLNYPWQKNYQPAYKIEGLIAFTRVCYVPYFSLPLVNEPGIRGVAPHLFRQTTHRLAHLLFLQDRSVRDAFEHTERGAHHAHFTGTPKVDALIEKMSNTHPYWPLGTESKHFKVLWAPHHSFGEAWLNFGVFDSMHQQMLEFARVHDDIEFVLRPHPYMFGTLLGQGYMSAEDLAAWRSAWDALPNTATDEHSEYAALMLAADLMFTDGISFIAEYPLVTKRPAIYWEKAGHWEFNPLGELAAATTVRVHDFHGFEVALQQAIEWGLPSRKAEIEHLFSAAVPYPGQSAQRILSVLRSDARALL